MPIFSVGTKTLFQQTAAPTGWTKETVNYNEHALRIVNGTTLGSGGTVNFTTALSSTAYTYSGIPGSNFAGGATLSTAQMPHHVHTVAPSAPGATMRQFLAFTPAGPTNAGPAPPITPPQSLFISWVEAQVGANFPGSTSHNHPISVSMSGNVFQPNSTLGVNYVDVIIGTKN